MAVAEIMDEAKLFARANLLQLCRELAEWHATGSLRDGQMRDLANKLAPIYPNDPLSLAESLVNRAAINHVLHGDTTP